MTLPQQGKYVITCYSQPAWEEVGNLYINHMNYITNNGSYNDSFTCVDGKITGYGPLSWFKKESPYSEYTYVDSVTLTQVYKAPDISEIEYVEL